MFVNGVFGAVATVVIWTFGEMILLPASAAYVSDIAPPAQSGAYMGLYTMGFSLAFAIGPWLGTQVMEDLALQQYGWELSLADASTAIMMWLLRQRIETSQSSGRSR